MRRDIIEFYPISDGYASWYYCPIKVDNGSEFISKAMDEWAHRNNVKLDFSRPGKPTDNAFIESFNGRLRQECLNQN